MYWVGRPTWESPLVWFASTIVHDGCHAMLYKQNRRRVFCFHYTPWWAWTGKEAERNCLQFQLAVLGEMDAPNYMQQYVASLWENPTYHRHWVRDW